LKLRRAGPGPPTPQAPTGFAQRRSLRCPLSLHFPWGLWLPWWCCRSLLRPAMGRAALSCCVVHASTRLLDPRKTADVDLPTGRSPSASPGRGHKESNERKPSNGPKDPGSKESKLSRRQSRGAMDADKGRQPSRNQGSDKDPEVAATKIQASFRGQKARKQMAGVSMAAAASISLAAARAEGDAQKAIAASPTEASPQKQKRKSSKESGKKSQEEEGRREAPEGISGRRSSPSQPAAVVLPCLSGSTRVKASLALAEENDDGYPCVDTSMFVNFIPLPYAPVLADGADDDCERPRSFVFKGQLIDIPLLPINRREQGAAARFISISHTASKGKGWAVVKSKMDGRGMAMQQQQRG